ncbi:MAG TPA: putative phage abortive infection protein [Microvirga sp.]|nr:putative phage abortive infection protein [Microvirga sp.]
MRNFEVDQNGAPPARDFFERIIQAPNVIDTLYSFFVAAIALITGVVLVGMLLLPALGIAILGPAGDYFGGFLNPLLTLLTFTGVLYTVYLQRMELAENRAETERQGRSLARQNFEATFFQMLTIHNGIVNAIDIQKTQGLKNGRDCFRTFRTRLRDLYNSNRSQYSSEEDAIRDIYNVFWDRSRQDLGHYFRYLFNFVRFVDDFDFSFESNPVEAKLRYMRLIRAQLSDYELIILFYNCLSSHGGEFKTYVEKHSLLNNIPDKLLLNVRHKGFFNPSAFERIAQPVQA